MILSGEFHYTRGEIVPVRLLTFNEDGTPNTLSGAQTAKVVIGRMTSSTPLIELTDLTLGDGYVEFVLSQEQSSSLPANETLCVELWVDGICSQTPIFMHVNQRIAS